MHTSAGARCAEPRWPLQMKQNNPSLALQAAPAPPAADSDAPTPHFAWDFGSSTAFLTGTRSLLQLPRAPSFTPREATATQLHTVKKALKMNLFFFPK